MSARGKKTKATPRLQKAAAAARKLSARLALKSAAAPRPANLGTIWHTARQIWLGNEPY